jgi:hypothetical protein
MLMEREKWMFDLIAIVVIAVTAVLVMMAMMADQQRKCEAQY